MVLLETNSLRDAPIADDIDIDEIGADVTLRYSSVIRAKSSNLVSGKVSTLADATAGNTGRLIIICYGDPDAASGTCDFWVQGSPNEVDWLNLSTLDETDFGAITVGTASTQIASLTFTPFPYLRIASTTTNQVAQRYVAYWQF